MSITEEGYELFFTLGDLTKKEVAEIVNQMELVDYKKVVMYDNLIEDAKSRYEEVAETLTEEEDELFAEIHDLQFSRAEIFVKYKKLFKK